MYCFANHIVINVSVLRFPKRTYYEYMCSCLVRNWLQIVFPQISLIGTATGQTQTFYIQFAGYTLSTYTIYTVVPLRTLALFNSLTYSILSLGASCQIRPTFEEWYPQLANLQEQRDGREIAIRFSIEHTISAFA